MRGASAGRPRRSRQESDTTRGPEDLGRAAGILGGVCGDCISTGCRGARRFGCQMCTSFWVKGKIDYHHFLTHELLSQYEVPYRSNVIMFMQNLCPGFNSPVAGIYTRKSKEQISTGSVGDAC